MTNTTALVSAEETYQQFLKYLKIMKESNIEEMVGDVFVVVAKFGNYQRIYHLTSVQYAFLMLTIRLFLGIIIGLILGKTGKWIGRWYMKSRLRKFVLEIRAGADEFATQLVEIYFPKDKDYIYILEVRYQQIKRYVIEAAKYGSLMYGVSKIAENVIWIHDRFLIQLLTKDLVAWGLIRDVFGGSVDNSVFFKTFTALTETNARTAAAVQVSGNTLTGSVITVVAYAVTANAAILPTLGALVGSVALSGSQFAFIRYFASLRFVFRVISPYLNVVFDKRTHLKKIEAQFEPSFPKDKLEAFTDQLTNNEVPNLDEILVLSGSDETLKKIQDAKTLGDLTESETRTSIRKRGLDRLIQTKNSIKNRYGAIKEYFFPHEEKPIWIRDKNYLDPYDANLFE